MIDLSIQTKLSELKEYMEVYINIKVSNAKAVSDIFWLYEKAGILLASMGTISIPTFDEYLNMKHDNR